MRKLHIKIHNSSTKYFIFFNKILNFIKKIKKKDVLGVGITGTLKTTSE